jgi:hypothetical protein
MASKSPPPSKWGRKEDEDDERRRRKKLEKGKEPTAKDADEGPLFDDTKFAVEQLRSAFRKFEGVGEAFDIKAHHDVYKDPSVKGLALSIHGLAEKLENLPVVKRAARRHFIFDDCGSDATTVAMAMTAATAATMAATAATTAGLRLIDRLLYQLVTMSVCFCVFVRFLDMNCLVCLSIMNFLVNSLVVRFYMS